MEEPKKKKLNHFDYDTIVSIFFGSKEIAYSIYDLRKEEWEPFRPELTACLYQYNSFESYDDYEFISIGEEAKNKAQDKGVFYVDKLSDKVEYLFAIEPNIKKPLRQAKDRLYRRAIVQYFKKIVDDNNIVLSKSRYLMTYPSYWTLEQAAYLRSLLQMACFVDKDDHPDRLIMYNEGDAIIRYIQSPLSSFPNIREGHKYMICDLSGSKIEMHLYDIKGPIDPQSIIKSASRCDWYNGSIENPAQMHITEEEFYPETILYISSILSTPSINITTKDLKNVNYGSVFKYWWEFDQIESLTEDDVQRNKSSSYIISQSFHDLYWERLNNVKEPKTEPLPQWIKYGRLELYPREIKEKILKPVCDRIIQYIKKIIETVTDTIDDIILVGREDHSYLIKLIADECKETTKMKIYRIIADDITNGAVLKILDNITAFDIYKPKIVLDDLDLSTKPEITNTQDVIILIDYELEETRVSYIHAQPGQIADNANIKHIMNWPGQSILKRNFPTLNVMLIPKFPRNIGKEFKIGSWWKRNLFSNFLSRNRKAMFILQENDGYNQEISTLTNTKFYTFEKDENSIILVTHHRRKRIRKIIEKLLTVTTTTNTTSSVYKVTRKRISFQEFSLLYFEYLAEFLRTYIYSKTGVTKDKYRYCITHDNQGHSEKFTLSNIRQIALESNLISADISTSLLVLDRTESTAIYCRKLIDTTIANDKEAHLYFLQVQLHPDRCLLVLNAVPILDHEDSNSYRENGKTWECVHKYAKTEVKPVNFMDIISENLWIHMQKFGSLLLRKCELHQTQKRFFNSKNMLIIKNMFYDYISTEDLNLENSEKEHTIRMCDKESGSCCYLVTTNLDLLEFAFNPAIGKLVSIIQGSILNQNLFERVQISDIFVMGELLNFQDYVSYKFLEELLLAKLKNIHFLRFDNIILQSMTKKTQVRKLSGREFQQVQDGSFEERFDSLAQISSGGSLIFSVDPRNLLVERLAVRTYIIKLKLHSYGKIVCNHPGRTLDNRDSYHIIILKGTPLKSLTLIEDKISKHFMITEYDEDYISFYIELLVVEDSNVSYLIDTDMDENRWLDKFGSSNFESLKSFPIFNGEFDPTFPFSFKFLLSQTDTHKFWIEKGKHRKVKFEYIREPILLKSCHND